MESIMIKTARNTSVLLKSTRRSNFPTSLQSVWFLQGMQVRIFCVIGNLSFPITQKTLREDAHFAEKKQMLRIPLKRERVASDSLFVYRKMLVM